MAMIKDTQLTNLQLELIKMFRFELKETQLLEIKRLLASYFSEQATSEMDTLWEANNWDADTMKHWANEHTRTSYKK